MRVPAHLPRVALAVMIAAIGTPTSLWAAPLNFAQYPAGTAYKAPVPNVILSVDTSGSMGSCDVSGTCTTAKQRISYVKQGLKATLVDSTKYDDQFRLAWQSFACDDIPSSDGNCGGKNAMGKFSGTHKTDFSSWVTALTASGITPSQKLVYSSGEYLKTTGTNSPWNATPGTADASPLACRRAYHIFLTDGGWNFTYGSSVVDGPFKTAMQLPRASATIPVQNADGKPTTFPDGTAYSITDAQTKIYRDSYGTEVRTTGSDRNNNLVNYSYPTLADMAFNYWATDLQPTIKDELTGKIRKTGDEGFTSAGTSVIFDQYWNPRNDPAKWQHLVQYTIGYGNSAGNLNKNTTTSPQFTGGTFGMYDTGFASLAVGKTVWDDVTSSKADGDYDNYRPQEMWHMAINSRGKFYPVAGGDLTAVFSDIFDDIIVDTTAPISGTTSVSRSVSRVGTNSYQTNYIAADDPNSLDYRWYGFVTSQAVSTLGVSTPNLDWGVVNNRGTSTADKLDAIAAATLGNRLVISYDIQSSQPSKAISFKWANFSVPTTTAASARMWLNKGTVGDATSIKGDDQGQDRLNFIRGDRTKEQKSGGKFRNRKSRQGDIVNSAIWYAGPPSSGYAAASYQTFAGTYRSRLPMLYVGGNDGMLHGFSAEDGVEKFAYVPHGVLQNLSKLSDLSDPTYNHQYYVDGSPFTGDVQVGATPTWRTYMAGTLGAGGRGYFVLDVTETGSAKDATSTVGNSFTEANAANVVVLDKTAAAVVDATPPSKPADPNADPDIGHIVGNPVVSESNQQLALHITRTNNNRWALILGNGYNSVNERPVLLIQYLDGDKSLKTIAAAAVKSAEAVGNGLSTPQFLDVNGDGAPDYVYAGDLRGNMWKFDISSASDSSWGVAFNGSPLFTAEYSAAAGNSSRQPITSPPVLRPNRTIGGLMVAFGTGQNLTEDDRSDKSAQSVYSILDNTRYTIVASGASKGKVAIASSPTPATAGTRSSLVSQAVNMGSKKAGEGISAGRDFWKLTTQEVTYACPASPGSCVAKKGWYLDLPVPGERVTSSLDFYDGSNILEIISEMPASGSATASGVEICAPTPQAAQPFRTLINIASGQPVSVPVMNTGSGYVPETVNYARMTASSKELRLSTKTEQIRKGNDGKDDKLARLPEVLIRPSWRQLK